MWFRKESKRGLRDAARSRGLISASNSPCFSFYVSGGFGSLSPSWYSAQKCRRKRQAMFNLKALTNDDVCRSFSLIATAIRLFLMARHTCSVRQTNVAERGARLVMPLLYCTLV